MMMPCLREYQLQDVAGVRHIVFKSNRTGEVAPAFKKVVEKDGNAEGDKVGVQVYRGGQWDRLSLEESAEWKPVIIKDWSELEQAQANWRNRGAKAYKQKDMNYFFVDELVRALEKTFLPAADAFLSMVYLIGFRLLSSKQSNGSRRSQSIAANSP